ncbi:hypothetical protein FACS1894200_12200 [Spirochaetia bacterium]|nr:hypothetical protein FACS1894200_12200 [Spirochaetia bacterium]
MGKTDTMYFRHCWDISYGHHERFDGKGYPRGISGFNIPLAARIVSLVDVFDALVSARVYKSAMSYADALTIIKNGRGTHFDPFLSDRVLEIHEHFEDIAQKYT